MLKRKVYRIGTLEALPLSCPICRRQMRIIVFINDAGLVMKLLDQNDESTQPTRMVPARGLPPLWEAAGTLFPATGGAGERYELYGGAEELPDANQPLIQAVRVEFDREPAVSGRPWRSANQMQRKWTTSG